MSDVLIVMMNQCDNH